MAALSSAMPKKHSEPWPFPDLLQQLQQRFPLEVLPVERRPLWQAQQQPQDFEKVLNWIRTDRTPSVVAFRDVFVARLNQPAEPAWSILMKISDDLGEFILTVGGRSLFGPGVDYWPAVDVEAMTEGDLVRVVRMGTRLSPLFPMQEHYPGVDWESCVLTMGDAICLLTASFLQVDQWVLPPHEIGDLFNRRLYPNRVVVCLRYGESAVFLATAPARVSSLLVAVQALEKRAGELLAKAHSSSTPAQHQVECYRIRGVGMAVVDERRAFVKIPAYTSWEAENAVAVLLSTPSFGKANTMDRFVTEFGGSFRRPRGRNCFAADLRARSLRGLPCPQGPERWEVAVFGSLVHHEAAAFLKEGYPQWSVDRSATKQLEWLSPRMARTIVQDWGKLHLLDLTSLKALHGATAKVLAQAEHEGVWLELSDAVAAIFAKLTKRKSPWENSLGMRFVPVAGTEVMFSLWHTRVQDFEAYVKATGHNATEGMESLKADGSKWRGGNWKSPGFAQTGQHPVCAVSWEDAQAFAQWLTEKERKEGKLNAQQSYRLPLDWEWSVAVGLDEPRTETPEENCISHVGLPTSVYPWGSQWPPPPGAGNYAGEEVKDGEWPADYQVIAGYRDGYARTSPVGSFNANRFGLYDMGGNLWQWCEDYFNGQSGCRVIRGGSWAQGDETSALSAYRGVSWQDRRADDVGFRLVLVGGQLR